MEGIFYFCCLYYESQVCNKTDQIKALLSIIRKLKGCRYRGVCMSQW